MVSSATGCVNVNTVLERRFEARQLTADLLVQFTRGADAANRAVMADTDEKSAAFAREAEQATGPTRRTSTRWGRFFESSATQRKHVTEAFVT